MEKAPKQDISFIEFIALIALLMALTAFTIDAVLPALKIIGQDLGQTEANNNQLIISVFFTGLAFGQLLYGPLSDSWGRKSPIYLGMSIFAFGSILSIQANSFELLIAGRFLQGIGLASPRTVSLAMIRDMYEGSEMAKVMSFIMVVFIFVPILAPMMGQGVLFFFSWRMIFALILVTGLLSLLWFSLRMKETLHTDRRSHFSVGQIKKAIISVVGNPRALSYTIAAGLISGAFIGFLNSFQQIFEDLYGLKEEFPLYFALLAASIGTAGFFNSRWVMRYGMPKMVKTAVSLFVIVSAVAWALMLNNTTGVMSLWTMMAYLMTSFFFIGILFSNLNSLAMEPLGKVAGTGASIVGSFSTFIGVFLGTMTSLQYDKTLFPVVQGIIIWGGLSLLLIFFTEYKYPMPKSA